MELNKIEELKTTLKVFISKEKRYECTNMYITTTDRIIEIDWIKDVMRDICDKYNVDFNINTYLLTIWIFDRYMHNFKIEKPEYQLVIVTSLLIAYKYEMYDLIDIKFCKYICVKQYSCKQIRKMEINLLKNINFQLLHQTIWTFVELYISINHLEINKNIIDIILNVSNDITILNKYLPSEIAVCSIFIEYDICDFKIKHHEYNKTNLEICLDELCIITNKIKDINNFNKCF